MLTLWAPQGTNSWNQYWLGPRGGPGLGAAAAVGYATTSTAAVTVQVNFPKCNDHAVQVPIPVGFSISSPPNENKAAIMTPSGDEWDLFDLTPPGATPYGGVEGIPVGCSAPAGVWQAGEAQLQSPGWAGDGSWHQSWGWSDSNILFGAGLLRLRDTQNTPTGGNWGHALMVTYSGDCAGGQTHPAYVYPATGSDGRTTGPACAPMGARFQLDPSINCNTWPSMVAEPEWMKQMCRTLQVYGAIIGHTAASQGNGDGIWTEWYGNLKSKYPWQDPTTGAWPSWYGPALDLPSDLLSHFRVIDWTKWTH